MGESLYTEHCGSGVLWTWVMSRCWLWGAVLGRGCVLGRAAVRGGSTNHDGHCADREG